MNKNHQPNEERLAKSDKKDEQHSMLCNEDLFFTGLRAAAEDTDNPNFLENNK